MRWCLSFAALFALPALAQDLRITGTVIDPAEAVIPNAVVRVFADGQASEIGHAKSNAEGRFDFAVPASGPLILRVSMPGFQTRRVKISAAHEAIVDVGRVRLTIGSCDAPWINCEYFGSEPPLRPIVSSGHLDVRPNCEIDFSQKPAVCRAASAGQSDIRVAKEDGHVALIASKGVSIARLDASNGTCEVSFTERRVQIDDLGRGDDICIRTRHGLIAHVFPMEDVEAANPEIRLYQVVRRPR